MFAKQFPFSSGPLKAPIMFIGEAPGTTESLTKIPFTGKSSKTLDSLLVSLNESRDTVHLTNLIKEYLPKNRNPRVSEVNLWKPILEEQIREVDPKLLVCLGKISSEQILEKKIKKFADFEGKCYKVIIAGKERIVLPIYHPAFLNRNKKVFLENTIKHLEMIKHSI